MKKECKKPVPRTLSKSKCDIEYIIILFQSRYLNGDDNFLLTCMVGVIRGRRNPVNCLPQRSNKFIYF